MIQFRSLFLIPMLVLSTQSALAQELPASSPSVKEVLKALTGKPSEKRTPIPEGDAYKRDRNYQELRRYDYLPYWLSHEKEMRLDVGSDQPPTIRVQDKSLVLAGEGFKIPDVQFDPEPSLELNQYLYLEEDPPPVPMKDPGAVLDPALENVQGQKPLVFHPEAAGYYDVPQNLPALEPAPKREPLSAPDPVSQTRVLLSTGNGTELRLQSGDSSWDLLRENEQRALKKYLEEMGKGDPRAKTDR